MPKVVKNIEINGNKLKCVQCGEEKYIKRDYYKSKDPRFGISQDRCYWCKECLEKKCFDANGIPNRDSFREILRDYLNLPFDQSLYEESLNKDKRLLGYYITQLNTRSRYKGKNLTWEDGQIEDKKDNKIINNQNEDINISDEEMIKLQKFWGKGFNVEQYAFLEEYYQDLTSLYDHTTPVQINLYKNMAKTQLLGNQCLMSGDISGFEKNMNLLSKLQNDANIKPVQDAASLNSDANTLGTWIKKFENEEPFPEPDEELKDVDGFRKYIRVWFLGHLCKILGVDNEYTQEYEEEVLKYTVNIEPDIINEDGEDNGNN